MQPCLHDLGSNVFFEFLLPIPSGPKESRVTSTNNLKSTFVHTVKGSVHSARTFPAPARQTVVQYCVITTENKNEIKPPFWEKPHGVVLHNDITQRHDRFKLVKQAIFVCLAHNEGVELLVAATVKSPGSDDLANVNAGHGQSLNDRLAER